MAISASCPINNRIRSTFNHKKPIGIIANISMKIIRTRDEDNIIHLSGLLLPYAWLHTGSSPDARPTSTE
ncbi:hypothetical protein HanRHA438_Chr09g0404531 [Helianthus annuus]|nr:hypothetical protein HanRHA438_Chr09g0404531 [Helianthus annuus]